MLWSFKEKQPDLVCPLKGHCGCYERRNSRGGKTGNQKVQGGEVVVRAGPVEVEMVRNGRI